MLKVQLLKFLHSFEKFAQRKFSSSSGISHSFLFSCCCNQNRVLAFISLCVCRFLLQNIFFKLISIFVFFIFILVDAFGFPIFWFHEDREITKNLFTLAENNFGERKLSCIRLNFGEILFAVTKRAVVGGQYRPILPSRVANQNTEFVAYCPLAELTI